MSILIQHEVVPDLHDLRVPREADRAAGDAAPSHALVKGTGTGVFLQRPEESLAPAETGDLIEEPGEKFGAKPRAPVLLAQIKRRYFGSPHVAEARRLTRLFGDPGDPCLKASAPFRGLAVRIQPVENVAGQHARIGLPPAGNGETPQKRLVATGHGHAELITGANRHGKIMAENARACQRQGAMRDRRGSPDRPRMPMPRPTLLFDLDGTLADTAADLCETLNVILELHGRERVPQERVRHLVGGGARLLLERGFRETGDPASEALLDRSFHEFLDYYGRHIADHTKLWPGVRDQLDRLSERGALMAVCTNKVEDLSRKLLEMLAIDHYFPVVIGGDTLPVKKPDPEHLFEAIRQLGGENAHSVMVGDSETDVHAAKNAKLPSICVTFGYTRIPVAELGAEATIDHFDEFPAALARLLPAHFG